tara:strand:- start:6301 stop:6474 length:174 start_codon:yes stop_codon:yes gene_type:complete
MVYTNQYKIKVVKETVVDLKSDIEAEQVAEMLACREDNTPAFGYMTLVYSDYEKIPV